MKDKIYKINNYIKIGEKLIHSKNVKVLPKNSDGFYFIQDNNTNIAKYKIGNILKEDDSEYSEQEWIDFYTANTGNFNSGEATPLTLQQVSENGDTTDRLLKLNAGVNLKSVLTLISSDETFYPLSISDADFNCILKSPDAVVSINNHTEEGVYSLIQQSISDVSFSNPFGLEAFLNISNRYFKLGVLNNNSLNNTWILIDDLNSTITFKSYNEVIFNYSGVDCKPVMQGVEDNTSTSALSNTDLETNYPNAKIGFKVYATAILTGALIYEKINNTGSWIFYSATLNT